jgi:hypothetical protein
MHTHIRRSCPKPPAQGRPFFSRKGQGAFGTEASSPFFNARPAVQAKFAPGTSHHPSERQVLPAHNIYAQSPSIQAKCAECEQEDKVQRLPQPEEDPLMPGVQRQAEGGSAGPRLSAALSGSKGSGTALPGPARSRMEAAFGADFSGVRVHTGADAVQMNRQLHAQAFTHGRDIYFNAGKYDPASVDGQHLLAHELTHVVQQHATTSPGATVQRMMACPPHLTEGDPTPSGWKPYHGASSVFHCGFRGILEDRSPTPQDPQNECFYDPSGTLVDEHHEYAGCRGTPNDYDSSASWFDHTFRDRGGIFHKGLGAFLTSRRHGFDEHFEREGQRMMDCHSICETQPWYMKGFCLQGCTGNIPM